MAIPNLAGLVARLDGTSGEPGSLESELHSIALPPLFRNDLAEWLDLDLLRLAVTETEMELIRHRDVDYVSKIRQQQREHAAILKSARDDGSLPEAPGVAISAARETYRLLGRLGGARVDERADHEKEFREQVRAEFPDPHAGLYTFLGTTVASFIWRPGVQRCAVWLAGAESRAEVEQQISATLNVADDLFIELAYYLGNLYNVFLSDPNPSPRIVYTDHELAWDPGCIHDAGSIGEFLSEFLSVGETVELVASELG